MIFLCREALEIISLSSFALRSGELKKWDRPCRSYLHLMRICFTWRKLGYKIVTLVIFRTIVCILNRDRLWSGFFFQNATIYVCGNCFWSNCCFSDQRIYDGILHQLSSKWCSRSGSFFTSALRCHRTSNQREWHSGWTMWVFFLTQLLKKCGKISHYMRLSIKPYWIFMKMKIQDYRVFKNGFCYR